MKVAGGVVALIAGIFGCIAAVVTLFFGGVGAAFSTRGANTVIGLKTYNKTAKVILVTYTALFGLTTAQIVAAEEATNGVQPAPSSSASYAGSGAQAKLDAQMSADAAQAEAYAVSHGQAAQSLADLAGTYTTANGNSTITLGKDGSIDISASSSSGDLGELKGDAIRDGDFLYRAIGDCGYAAVLVEQNALVVEDDNGGCDGASVSLNGKYIRQGATQAKTQTPSWNDVYKKAQAANNAETLARLGVGSAQSVLATQQAAVNAAVALTSQCPNATAACENGIHVTAFVMGDQISNGNISHVTTQFSNVSGTNVYVEALLKTDLPYNAPLDLKIFQKEYGSWTFVHEGTMPVKSLVGKQATGYRMILKGGENAQYRLMLSMNGLALGQIDFTIGQPPVESPRGWSPYQH